MKRPSGSTCLINMDESKVGEFFRDQEVPICQGETIIEALICEQNALLKAKFYDVK